MELCQSKSFRAFDDDDSGICDRHADFDDGCGAENVYFSGFEIEHDFFFFRIFHFAVKNADFIFREYIFFQSFRFSFDRAREHSELFRRIRLIYARTYDVCLSADPKLHADFFIHFFSFFFCDYFSDDWLSTDGHLV